MVEGQTVIQGQERAFALQALKSIKEIQSTDIQALNRIADFGC